MRSPFNFVLAFVLLLLVVQDACKPKKLENGKLIADEVERRTVKRFKEQDILAEAKQLGDNLTSLADSLLHAQLKISLKQGGLAAALQYYPPEQYPAVQALARQYQAVPRRQQQLNNNSDKAQTQQLNQTEILYTKPIYLDDASCLPCHGVNTGSTALPGTNQLAKAPTGFKIGDRLGWWYIVLQRKAILERLTLKR